jgi:hypothetical protein
MLNRTWRAATNRYIARLMDWWDSHPHSPIWRYFQFHWRWCVCTLPTMILLSWLFGGVGGRSPRPEDWLALGICVVAAVVWATETCWRRR